MKIKGGSSCERAGFSWDPASGDRSESLVQMGGVGAYRGGEIDEFTLGKEKRLVLTF